MHISNEEDNLHMIKISYTFLLILITCIWVLVRGIVSCKAKRFDWKRELQLILVYICIVVVARFTFFPFSRMDGKIQPLVFNAATAFPPRINLLPFVYLFDYPRMSEALLNLIGNTTMFIPLGVVWPIVFKKLNSHWKVISAGVGCSMCIEILQLPFYDRVSDIDDLILNSAGFITGYLLYLLVKTIAKAVSKRIRCAEK